MIRSGQSVVISPTCAEPQSLVKALVECKDRFENVKIYTMMPLGKCPYASPEMAGHFKVKAFSVGPGLIDAVRRGQADYIPCHLSQIPALFSERIIPVDVALVQLSPPDRNGYCTLGVSVSYMREVLNRAKLIIAEINEKMPRTHGDTLIPISKVDYVVESSHPLFTLPPQKIGEVEKKIGAFISELVPDGAVIQIGIGNIAEAVLEGLKNKRMLSIHSGTFSDGVIQLVESGALKTKGKGSKGRPMVATELIGTSKLYQFCHDNPMVEMWPIDYTHNIHILSNIKGFVSINSAVQIDLTGQVNAEMVGETLINGIGGMLDFLRGANASPGGKAIIACPSTAKNGKVSRIVPKLDAGTSVSVGRADIDFVVTEFGIAQLRGKSLSERAKELISIAHPDFRGELKQVFKKINS